MESKIVTRLRGLSTAMRFKKYANKSIRVHTTVLMRLRLSTLRACLQGELERVTLVEGLP